MTRLASFSGQSNLLEAPSGQNSGSASRAITVDTVGNVFVAGSFAGATQFGGQTLTSLGGEDAFLAKIDGNSGSFFVVAVARYNTRRL